MPSSDRQMKCEVERCRRDAACRWTVTSVNGFVLSLTAAYLCAVHRREAMKLTAALSSRLRRTRGVTETAGRKQRTRVRAADRMGTSAYCDATPCPCPCHTPKTLAEAKF